MFRLDLRLSCSLIKKALWRTSRCEAKITTTYFDRILVSDTLLNGVPVILHLQVDWPILSSSNR